MTQPPIPDDWTPEQTLAVYEFIDEILDAIWDRYAIQLVELMQEERQTTFDREDEELPF